MPSLEDEHIDMLLNGLSLLIKNYDLAGYNITDVAKISLLAKLLINTRNLAVKTIDSSNPTQLVKDRLGVKEDEEIPGLGQSR